jgi:hypothetical protein
MGRRSSSPEAAHIRLALRDAHLLEICCADHAECGTIDEVPEQCTSCRREATKRGTEDSPSTGAMMTSVTFRGALPRGSP